MSLSVQSSIREQQQPTIRELAERIEATWQRHLDLTPYQLPDNLGYVESRLEGEKLIIENRCYQTPTFRKLHLELAQVGQGIDILHCVMFPRTEYALPIFGCDLVGARGQISAAIVDLSPISPLGLSMPYQQALIGEDQEPFSQPRALPDWGDIFSDRCCFVRPADMAEAHRFIDKVERYLTIHCQQAATLLPTPHNRAAIFAGQQRYCRKQRQNDKTRRILEKAFGDEWADRYMTTVLFDLPDT
ncbi:MAG: phycocyanobilin:ferredoxin oxidoreductase [Cyanobacteria bacterium P01_G01_bin.38]